MSKITNDAGLTLSGTACFTAVPIMATVGVKGLTWLAALINAANSCYLVRYLYLLVVFFPSTYPNTFSQSPTLRHYSIVISQSSTSRHIAVYRLSMFDRRTSVAGPSVFNYLMVCVISTLAEAASNGSLTLWRPLLPHGYSYEAICVPDRAKPSFVIFDIRALWRSALIVRVPGYQKLQMMA